MTVHELLHRISSHELSEWAAYERVSGPLGPARSELLAGIISATVANAMGGGKATPSDFLPTWDRQPTSAEEMFRRVQAMNSALGGTTQQRKEE